MLIKIGVLKNPQFYKKKGSNTGAVKLAKLLETPFFHRTYPVAVFVFSETKK